MFGQQMHQFMADHAQQGEVASLVVSGITVDMVQADRALAVLDSAQLTLSAGLTPEGNSIRAVTIPKCSLPLSVTGDAIFWGSSLEFLPFIVGSAGFQIGQSMLFTVVPREGGSWPIADDTDSAMAGFLAPFAHSVPIPLGAGRAVLLAGSNGCRAANTGATVPPEHGIDGVFVDTKFTRYGSAGLQAGVAVNDGLLIDGCAARHGITSEPDSIANRLECPRGH
jgi:hypothetical protein